MLKHRKRILFAVVLLVFSLGLAWFLRPRNEPKYRGRYLSEWMEGLTNPVALEYAEAVKQAIETVGTNGLPLFLNWMGSETPDWKVSLRTKLPNSLLRYETVECWFSKDWRRSELGLYGIRTLGTNAAPAIPELKSLLQLQTNFQQAIQFRKACEILHALSGIGREAVPVLQETFSDLNRPKLRPRILWHFRRMAFDFGCTNECMPIIAAALADSDPKVRLKATNLLDAATFEELFRIPLD